MPITRRQFIKRSAGAVTIGLVLPHSLITEARQLGSSSNRKLVIIQLAGGNDGLNTVIPYTDSVYKTLRPTLAFNESELKTSQGASTIIDDHYGFHPAMGAMKQLYDQGLAAVVLGAGYPNPTLSHFLSMDIWHTADMTGLSRTGWLGRFADFAFVARSGLDAVCFGSLQVPKTLSAERYVVPNIINYDLYNFITDPAYPADARNQLSTFNAAASRNLAERGFAGPINNIAFESVRGAQSVQQTISAYRSNVQYPTDNPLAIALKMVAQLMSTAPEVAITYVQMGGFDNHADQAARRDGRVIKTEGYHATLLKWFSEAVKLFHDDLVEHNIADQVLMLQWSEFGRRPEENASIGTDHGTAAPLFVIGNQVRGGLHGEQPQLDSLDPTGNLRFKVDFRQVYAEVLDKWLGADSKSILGGSYERVGFLN